MEACWMVFTGHAMFAYRTFNEKKNVYRLSNEKLQSWKFENNQVMKVHNIET